ncbi:MAG TPA: hypothetical protein VE907_10280 [Gammaproteobacteria bacterium]|nr:hypothetical protein [Gammaproteobacteria bacterium]
MKILYALLASAAFAMSAAAQTDVAGTWQGELAPAPGSKLKIQFVISGAPGAYAAVVTSPDSGAIKDVKAASVTFADGKLAVAVPALSGGYAGTLRNGAIEGEWSQEGQKLPLNLRPYASPTLTKAEMDALRGEWVGKLTTSGIELPIVLRFSDAGDGTFKGMLDSPDQNARDIPLIELALDGGEFSAKVPLIRGEYKGKLQGEELAGVWTQIGSPMALTLKKGKYVAPSHDLDLPAAAREVLVGRWRGTLGPLEVIVRFETGEGGRIKGLFDVPAQNVKDFPITEATLSGAKLTFRITVIGAEFAGDVGGGKMTGEWKQLGMTNPLTLTRE